MLCLHLCSLISEVVLAVVLFLRILEGGEEGGGKEEKDEEEEDEEKEAVVLRGCLPIVKKVNENSKARK